MRIRATFLGLMVLASACGPDPCIEQGTCREPSIDPTAIIVDGKIIGYKGP